MNVNKCFQYIRSTLSNSSESNIVRLITALEKLGIQFLNTLHTYFCV